MKLAEIKQMHGESLYDRDGNLVGKWYGERGMLADCFIARERVCHVDVNKHGRAYCTNCGCDDWCLADGSPFCPNCGARVVDE